MYYLKNLFLISLFFVTTACSTVDKGLMTVSDTVSSYDPVTGERQVSLVSEEAEIKKATEQTAMLLAAAKEHGAKIDGDTPHYDRVKEIFERLLEVTHRQHLPWEIHVVEDKNFNAFTIGGGKVFVLTGLLDGPLGVQSDDELAAVLAHEMAHVTARHATEKAGKLLLTKLADSDLKTKTYDASFTTIQEDEADKYSVVYSALAGYDPEAAISVWERFHKADGSSTSNLLYDHPLNEDRAANLKKYSSLVMSYYVPNEINKDFESIARCNRVYCFEEKKELKAGEGGGLVALIETLGNTLEEALDAKRELRQRERKKLQQENEARRKLLFKQLRVANGQSGGRGLFGVMVNATGKEIIKADFSVLYWVGQEVIYRDSFSVKMNPYERRDLGIKLKPIRYTNVSISPEYVLLAE